MSAAHIADRARIRYADAIYRSALLRDPDPERASHAVVAAFTRVDWTVAELDDRVEVQLIQGLPSLPRFRLRRPRPLAPLPPRFWKLPPVMRLALGLRLLRGWPAEMIAAALARPMDDVRTLLLDGVAATGGDRLDLTGACRACLAARLDDPGAARDHLRSCPTCRATLPRWEASEADLAAQLSAAVGDRALPPASGRALEAALECDGPREAGLAASAPLLLRLGLMVVVLTALGALIWPRRPANARLDLPHAVAPAPRELIDRAWAAFDALPAGSGIVHRRWQLAPDDPQRTLQADEWVDVQQPARHRMQLLNGTIVEEWQAGDGQDRLRYYSQSTPAFCGPLPKEGVASHTLEVNSWPVDVAEQARMRAARWQSGVWALGKRYLDLAARAETLYSTGRAGGITGTLTLSAAGREISGTLLLRLDPSTFALQEVRELRPDNGRIDLRVPWRLLLSESVEPQKALLAGLLSTFPAANAPRDVERALPIIDRACPLAGAEQALSIPRTLVPIYSRTIVIGLPVVPAGVDHAMLVGSRDRGIAPNGAVDFMAPDATQLIYLGAGKRLVFWPQADLAANTVGTSRAGPWHVQIDQQAFGVFAAIAGLYQTRNDRYAAAPGNVGFRAWAEGWNHDELQALLATARPLRLDDWSRTAALFYEPLPLDPDMRDLLARIGSASAPRPGGIRHQVEVTTRRRAPFLAALADPYHLPESAQPATQRSESWSEVDPSGTRYTRTSRATTGRDGQLIEKMWTTEQRRSTYRALDNAVSYETTAEDDWIPPDPIVAQLLRYAWSVHRLPDGSTTAETSQPLDQTSLAYLPDVQRAGTASGQEPWLLDVEPTTVTLRLEFGPDGRLRQSETLGIAQAPALSTTAGLTRRVLLERTVVETDTWVSSAPPAAFSFTPPADARQIDATMPAFLRTGPLGATVTTSITDTARAVAFPVWSWRGSPELLSFRAARIPPDRPDPDARGPANDQMLLAGLAVELSYATQRGNLTLLQGPAATLRPLFQQRPPEWRTSEKLTLRIGGTEHDVWVMRAEDASRQWAAVEIDGSLLFLQHGGPADELDAILMNLGGLQKVAR